MQNSYFTIQGRIQWETRSQWETRRCHATYCSLQPSLWRDRCHWGFQLHQSWKSSTCWCQPLWSHSKSHLDNPDILLIATSYLVLLMPLLKRFRQLATKFATISRSSPLLQILQKCHLPPSIYSFQNRQWISVYLQNALTATMKTIMIWYHLLLGHLNLQTIKLVHLHVKGLHELWAWSSYLLVPRGDQVDQSPL